MQCICVCFFFIHLTAHNYTTCHCINETKSTKCSINNAYFAFFFLTRLRNLLIIFFFAALAWFRKWSTSCFFFYSIVRFGYGTKLCQTLIEPHDVYIYRDVFFFRSKRTNRFVSHSFMTCANFFSIFSFHSTQRI